MQRHIARITFRPVLLWAHGCPCKLHRRTYSKALPHTSCKQPCALRQKGQHGAEHASSGHPAACSARCCRGMRHFRASAFSKAATTPPFSSTCRAASAGHTASLTSDTRPSDFDDTAISDSEFSDDEEPDINISSTVGTDVDEAVTGYMQHGSAGVQLVKSKAEAHDQVQHTFCMSVLGFVCRTSLLSPRLWYIALVLHEFFHAGVHINDRWHGPSPAESQSHFCQLLFHAAT